jgi:hypothetical protein
MSAGGAFIWLPAGTGDPVFVAGEVYSGDYNPNGGGGVHTFAILDDLGTSGTGIAAWSATYNATDQSGHCVFTLQFSGHALK